MSNKLSIFGVDKYTDAEAVAAAKTVKLDDFATPDDNTDLDASTTEHGLLPKLSDVITEFLNGQGGWSVPAGGVSTFVALDDTPANFTGAGGKLVVVNATPDALEFVPITDFLEGAPTEDLATKAPTSEWAYDHSVATTGVHGVGTGTIGSVSTANKSFTVGTGETYTTIQAAVDAMEDVIIHDYTITVKDHGKKTGTADSDVANKLHDTGEFTVATTWAGRAVFNIGTGNWGVVSARDSDDQLSIVDSAGDAYDLFPAGNEAYVIAGIPYREQVALNSLPAVNPSHLMLGTLTIRTEYYWYADCDTQVNAGEILDADADFSNVEVGDRVFVLSLNGTLGRPDDAEYGTVDDVSQVASHIVRTNLTKTPTTNWKYVIVKTELSGSDDGTEAGTARDYCIFGIGMDNVKTYGFYFTFSDHYFFATDGGRSWEIYGCIGDACDNGAGSFNFGSITGCSYCMFGTNPTYCATASTKSYFAGNYCYFPNNSYAGFSSRRVSYGQLFYCYFPAGTLAGRADYLSHLYLYRCNITSGVTTGVYADLNSSSFILSCDNNATTPESPAGTTEGAFIK